MPSAAKVRWSKVRVALMAVFALSIFGVLAYLLTGSGGIFQRSVYLHVYMKDATGVQTDSPVRLSGILVGNVKAVRLSQSKDPNRVVKVDLSIKERYLLEIPEDSKTEISADNLLGDKFIDITKGQSPKHVPAGGELRFVPPREINRADLMASAQQILRNVDALLADIEAGKSGIGKFIKGEEVYNLVRSRVMGIQNTVDALRSTTSPIGRFLYEESLYEEINAPVKQLNEDLSQWRADKFLKDPAQYDEMRRSVADLRHSVEDLKKGKFLSDDELYRKLQKQLDGLERAVDQMTSGRLFASAQLYESLNGSTQQLQVFLKELRTNPRKFLRVKLF